LRNRVIEPSSEVANQDESWITTMLKELHQFT
jgi:hypothetical protein